MCIYITIIAILAIALAWSARCWWWWRREAHGYFWDLDFLSKSDEWGPSLARFQDQMIYKSRARRFLARAIELRDEAKEWRGYSQHHLLFGNKMWRAKNAAITQAYRWKEKWEKERARFIAYAARYQTEESMAVTRAEDARK